MRLTRAFGGFQGACAHSARWRGCSPRYGSGGPSTLVLILFLPPDLRHVHPFVLWLGGVSGLDLLPNLGRAAVLAVEKVYRSLVLRPYHNVAVSAAGRVTSGTLSDNG